MPADQAAGLRRRASEQPVHFVYCLFDQPESTVRFAQALHQVGQVPLLVDMQGRLFADSSTRSLFDWRKQLELGQLHTLPQAYGDGWYAPGLQTEATKLQHIAHAYDPIVFDAGPGSDLIGLPGVPHSVIVEVDASQDSMLRVYRLAKTLFHAGGRFRLGLLGSLAACEHIRAACTHFLGVNCSQDIYSVLREDGAFAALAIRMADEETGLKTR